MLGDLKILSLLHSSSSHPRFLDVFKKHGNSTHKLRMGSGCPFTDPPAEHAWWNTRICANQLIGNASWAQWAGNLWQKLMSLYYEKLLGKFPT